MSRMTATQAIQARRYLLLMAVLSVGFSLAFTTPAGAAESFGLERPFESLLGVEEGLLDRNEPLLNVQGSLDTEAGSHPYALTTTIVFNHEVTEEEEEFRENLEGEEIGTGSPAVFVKTYGDPKHMTVNLPAGVVVNPNATSVRCTEGQFEEKPGAGGGCPIGSTVGIAIPYVGNFGENLFSPVYNLVPPPGTPAELGVNPGGVGFVFHIGGKVRTGGDYGLSGEVSDITQKVSVYGARIVLWGVPSAESHDRYRGICATDGPVEKQIQEEYVSHGKSPFGGNRYDCTLKNVERTGKPLLTMPGSCGPLDSTLSGLYSWQKPDNVLGPFHAASPAVTGCEQLHFNPSLNIAPEPSQAVAESPSGLNVDLKFPLKETEGRAEANLKQAVVTLPEGMGISPSAANGLGACPATGPEGFNLHEEETEAEDKKHAPHGHCPNSSKIGTVEVLTPLLETPLTGAVYLAQPHCGGSGQPECSGASATNGELYGLYLEVEGQGAIVKLAGTVSANLQTGRLTATFDNNPQLPFGDLKLRFFSGPRAPLVTPSACGTYTTESKLTPWSGTGPVSSPSGFSVEQGCGHSFNPSFSAGTNYIQAGAYTPFSLTLSRQDGEQRFGSIQVTMPPGLLANLRSVQQCPEPQAAKGECGAASLIGNSTAAVGPGSDPYWVKGGKVYLTGPYNGAPFGLSIVVPAVAGPFNLGNVIARAGVEVDSHTAQAIVTSSIPTIKDGIPLDVRTVNVTIDRPGFMFNPTNCTPSTVNGMLESTATTKMAASSPFDVANCAALPFKPSFKVATAAKTSKSAGASLVVKVGSSSGQANIAKVRVTLPKQLPARLTTLQKACTEVQFNANPALCPAASIVGTATAVTPVLAHPLTGPAYLVSHGGAAFPDLVFVLQGEGVKLYLDGNTNIKKGITSSTFNSVPDAPISTFETSFPEGPHSVLATNLPTKAKGGMCQQKLTMPTTLTGQNGAVVRQTTKIAVTGCPKKAKVKTKRKKKQTGR